MFSKIFITPVGFDCNLGCNYCYNTTNGCRKITEKPLQLISDEVLVKLFTSIKPYINDRLLIIWHGGEPLLAGKDFFRGAHKLAKRLLGQIEIEYGVQTNATLVDRDWCLLMKDLNIKPSTSLDGPAKFHDVNRFFPCGRGSYEAAVNGFKMMKEVIGYCGVLTVLNKTNFQYPEELFEWVIDNEIFNIDFQLCAKQRNQSDNKLSLSGEEAANALIRLFDLWFEHDDERINVRIFSDAIKGVLGGQPRVCSWHNGCANYLSFDNFGNVFACARYHVYPETSFGNIVTDKFSSIVEARCHGLAQQKIAEGQQVCAKCKWNKACGGGCPFLKYATYGNFDKLYPFCLPRKRLFQHIAQVLDKCH